MNWGALSNTTRAGQREPARDLDFCLPRANLRRPLVKVRTSPAISLSPGGRALFRCDVPPRSQPRRGFGPGAFYFFASRREFGDQTTRDNADAFHAKQHRSANVRQVEKAFRVSGGAYRVCG